MTEREALRMVITYILDQDNLECGCSACCHAREELSAFAESEPDYSLQAANVKSNQPLPRCPGDDPPARKLPTVEAIRAEMLAINSAANVPICNYCVAHCARVAHDMITRKE
jgi:hypothetical protein